MHELISKHKFNGLLVDTNLLILLVVGLYNKNRIQSHPRTKQFTIDDFTLLANLVGQFAEILTTPNIMTEISNLCKSKMQADEWILFASKFRALKTRVSEFYVPSEKAVDSKWFDKFGLTDAVILTNTKPALLLTDDVSLAIAAQSIGIDAINFNHVRFT